MNTEPLTSFNSSIQHWALLILTIFLALASIGGCDNKPCQAPTSRNQELVASTEEKDKSLSQRLKDSLKSQKHARGKLNDRLCLLKDELAQSVLEIDSLNRKIKKLLNKPMDEDRVTELAEAYTQLKMFEAKYVADGELVALTQGIANQVDDRIQQTETCVLEISTQEELVHSRVVNKIEPAQELLAFEILQKNQVLLANHLQPFSELISRNSSIVTSPDILVPSPSEFGRAVMPEFRPNEIESSSKE